MTTSFFNETTDHELDIQALKDVHGGAGPMPWALMPLGGALGGAVLVGGAGVLGASLIADVASGKELGSTLGEVYNDVTDSLDDLVNGGGDVNTGNAGNESGNSTTQ